MDNSIWHETNPPGGTSSWGVLVRFTADQAVWVVLRYVLSPSNHLQM